jgi:hypothetical protein
MIDRPGREGTISYDGRRFRPVDGEDGHAPVAVYHQDGDAVWAEFRGGRVRRGSIAGTCGPDGTLRFGYCMVLADGEVIVGHCRSVPRVLGDGRIRLTEHWERYQPRPAAGVSHLEELGPLTGR